MPAALAYTFVVFGILLIYAELVRPGSIVPGSVGVLLFFWGGHGLWQHAPQPRGILLFVVSAALFACELAWDSRHIAGALGTLAFGAGSIFLCGRSPVPGWLAVLGALLVGVPAVLLATAGRRARHNKALG